MPTRLGDVWMQFRLDTGQAQRDLTQLERRVEHDKARGLVPVAGGKGPGGAGVPRAEREAQSFLKQLTSAAIKKAGGGLQGSPSAAVGASLLGQTSEFVPPQLAKGLAFAGKAVAVYGIASETAKVLPEALALGKELAGIKPGTEGQSLEAVERTLNELRAKVVALEAKVVSIYEAGKQTIEFTEAARRLTGKMPDTQYYFQQNQQISQQQYEVNKKFESWKAKEAPFNTARTMLDYFKRALTH